MSEIGIGIALSRAIDHVNGIDGERQKKKSVEPFGYDTNFAGQYVNPGKPVVRYSDMPGSWKMLLELRRVDDEFPDGLNPT